MVSQRTVLVFDVIPLRKLVMLLLLLGVALVLHQAMLKHERQLSRLVASQQAEQARLLTEQEAEPEQSLFDYDDALAIEIFNAMLSPPYTKLDLYGGELDQSDDYWHCVKSNDNSLIWEVKTRDGGMRDAKYNYSWFTPGDDDTVPISGLKDGGSCLYSDCDTHSYIDAINKQQLCGLSDWRLPTTEELQSIVLSRAYIPKVDPRYFPNTQSYYYWSDTIYASYYDPDVMSWFPGVQAFQYWTEILSINDYNLMTSVNYLNGLPYGARKQRNYHIRLVSGRMQ